MYSLIACFALKPHAGAWVSTLVENYPVDSWAIQLPMVVEEEECRWI